MVMNVRGNDITIRWDKCTAMLSKAELGSTKDFGSIVLVMTDRCSGHEPELRAYIAPVAEAQPESETIPSDDSEMDIAPDTVTAMMGILVPFSKILPYSAGTRSPVSRCPVLSRGGGQI